MKEISGVLITFNEEAKVESALRSLSLVCDEIVVVDSGSTDATIEICRRYTDRVLSHPWEGYVKQKQFATDQASHDWVLSLDADEKLSLELQQQLLDWKSQEEEKLDAYSIPRLTSFMGRWIRHTSWYPDFQRRLFRKSAGCWTGGRVHEGFRVDGPGGRFSGHILHYTYCSASEYLVQLERFSTLASADRVERGKKTTVPHLVLGPVADFVKNYVLKWGFLDGLPGFVVSMMAAVSTFFKHLKTIELQKHPDGETSEWDVDRSQDL